MKVIRLYAATSKACNSTELGRFYVFEKHIVYKIDTGTFAVAFSELENEKYLNAVDGFNAWNSDFMKPKYTSIGGLTNTDLRKIRRRIKLCYIKNK